MLQMNFIMALSPLLFVLAGILFLKKPAMQVAPLALLYTIGLSFTYFNIRDLLFQELVAGADALIWKGIKEGAKIVMLVFSSFLLLNLMQRTGAIRQVQRTLASVTKDRRAQLVIVGMMVPIFLEGAAGAGSPAAIAAPFLVGLGFHPLTAIVVALLGDATPCSWGGAGLTTITGGDYLVQEGLSTAALNSAMAGRIHMFGVLIIPFLIVAVAFGRKGFRGILSYLLFAGISTSLLMFGISNFIGPEITSLGTGLLSIVLSVLFLKKVPLSTPEEYLYQEEFMQEEQEGRRYSSFRALAPYLLLVVLLPVVRYTVPFSVLTTFGYIVWVDCVLFFCAAMGGLILGVSMEDFVDTMKTTLKRVVPVMVTMASLLSVSYLMQSADTDMMTVIASTIAGTAGMLYPAAAVLIGASGSFVTGTGLGSNIMFAPMHVNAAQMLQMNPITVFAGQNAGGSLGNMVCPNNVVAACATVDIIGREGEVMRKGVVVFAILLLEYMVLTMVYTHILFPQFGL